MNLVTGATGHIGNVLIRKLLEKGEKVRALVWRDEDTTPLKGLDVETIEGDVLDPGSLKPAFLGVESVYHLAGIISIMPGEDLLVRRVNVEGTRNILEAARQAGVKRVVYTSSIHAIQRAPHGVTIDETLPYDLKNPYGCYDSSKAQASAEVLNAVQAGLDAVIVCPTGVIGPFDFRGSELGTVLRDAAWARPILYIEGAYDFVDVRDVAEGLVLAAAKGRCGESYLLSGHKVTVRDLIEEVRLVTGKNLTSIKVPYKLAEFISLFTPAYYRLTKAKPRITPYSLEVLQSNSDVSHAKATRELGYQPRPLRRTIQDTVRWFLKDRTRSQA